MTLSLNPPVRPVPANTPVLNDDLQIVQLFANRIFAQLTDYSLIKPSVLMKAIYLNEASKRIALQPGMEADLNDLRAQIVEAIGA